MACPGSIRMSEGLPNTSSPYAIEGSAAHALAERALRRGLDPEVWLDTEIAVRDGGEVHHVLVDEDMVDAVRVFVEFVRSQVDAGELMIEQRFDLSPLNPPGPMFGTSDAVVWDANERRLHVIDFKYGRGVAVDAVENSQLRYYALGAVTALRKRPELVTTTIVQPRAEHPAGIIRSDTFSFDDLVAFKEALFAAARATQDPDAPLVVGDHCRFCPALAICPAQAETMALVAQQEFALTEPEPVVFPAPEHLSLEQIQLVLKHADNIEAWLGAVRRHVHDQLEAGVHIPGWKLVDKRATRRWVDDSVVERLESEYEIDLHVRKPMSPAQAEKALKAIGVKLDPELVIKQSGGRKLAPDHDPRPALLPSAQEDFKL